MYKKYISLILLSLCFFNSVYAYNEPASCSAQAAVVLEATTGAVLYEKNASQKLGMASTTKIMTAICAIEHSDTEKTATVSSRAAGVEGSSMYLESGEKIKLGELIKGLMLVSGNDAATAIAEAVSGNESSFVLLMNQKANEIGVKNTSFQNPHGLSVSGHYTTALDLAKITAYAMKNPVFKEIVSSKSGTATASDGKKHFLTNHNKLLKMYDGCIGVKTGFTKATGRCLVTAAERDGLRLICVTLNDGDDWRDHTAMYDRAFSEYTAAPFLKKGTEIINANVINGEKKKASFCVSSDITVPVKKGEKHDLSLVYDEKQAVLAPVEKDVTKINAALFSDGKKIGDVTLTASESIGFETSKSKMRIKGFFRRLFGK